MTKTQQKLIIVNLIWIILSAPFVMAQDLDYGTKIFGLTAIVNTYSNNTLDQGSSFFYYSDKETFLVSNRHVLYPKETMPDSIVFTLKKRNTTTGQTEWKPVTMDRKYLIENMRLHMNKQVDVASIKVDGIFKTILESRFYRPYAISNPDSSQLNEINPEIGDDVLIIGYPRGYYDEYNKIPILKSGVIASFFGLPFQNLPCYIVDSKLYPGSSGSIVISKHQPVIIKEGQPAFANRKDFILLGIYSGEPYKWGQQIETDEEISIKKEKFDLGIVWYANIIDELKAITELR